MSIWKFIFILYLKERRYIQKKGSKNTEAGTFLESFDFDEGYTSVKDRLLEKFFPNGRNYVGTSRQMEQFVANSKDECQDKEGFTAGSFFHGCTTQRARLYLMTKKQVR